MDCMYASHLCCGVCSCGEIATRHAHNTSCLQEFVEGPFSQSNLDPGASMIIPVPGPAGGVVVVGESVIMYVRKKRSADDQAVKSIRVKATIIKVGSVDGAACFGPSAAMHCPLRMQQVC